jgi:two-component system NtrC family response regulator
MAAPRSSKQEPAPQHPALAGYIAADRVSVKLLAEIEKIASADSTVLIMGESGTGKDLVASLIHYLRNPQAPLVKIDCAALPPELFESELFGYEKGAFTGAAKQTLGKIELANEGTFFLDEVGDLPLPLQAKLLRFLQERVIERIGGHKEIPVDVRIVCATHQKLKELTAAGRFREDLYYRLSEIVITIPPLKERVGDAVLLAQHFKNKFAAAEGRSTMNFSPDAISLIETYPWPGNVREMENCIKRAVIMADGSQIGAEDLGLHAEPVEEEPLNLRQVREEAEYKAVIKALARVDGNIAKASEILGVSRPTLYDLMERHGLK